MVALKGKLSLWYVPVPNPPQPTTETVQGTVTYKDSVTPFQGCGVQILGEGGEAKGDVLMSDENGKIETQLEAGTYTVNLIFNGGNVGTFVLQVATGGNNSAVWGANRGSVIE